jgi:hypothetical protein
MDWVHLAEDRDQWRAVVMGYMGAAVRLAASRE